MPFHNLNLTHAFTENGFSHSSRYYLDLDLSNHRKKSELPAALKIVPWDSSYLARTAEMTFLSYENQADAEICEDYRTRTGCEGYLRSLVENPGCGIFMPEASFMAIGLARCAVRICFLLPYLRRSRNHPSNCGPSFVPGQKAGQYTDESRVCPAEGAWLSLRKPDRDKENLRAFEWYQRLGFKIRKEFGAYVWQR